MKKVLVLFMVLVFTLSMTLNALAGPGKGKGNGGNKAEVQAGADVSDKALMKQFKQELNQYVKDPVGALQNDLDALNASKLTLEAEIADATAVLAGLTPDNPDYIAAQADLEAKTASMDSLNDQIAAVETKLDMDPEALKKEFINERFMVIKSEKSGFDLSDYDTAEALIAAMYAQAYDDDASDWNLWVNNSENLLKLEGPLYLKGSKIMFPLASLRDLEIDVTWDEATKTVTVIGNGITVVFSPEGKSATTKADVADGAIEFVPTVNPGENTGTITGTVTDPVTGAIYNVEATGTFYQALDINNVVTENLIEQSVTANIVDPESGEIIKSVNVVVSGTLTDPSLTFDQATLDVAMSDTITNCGRAYHPLDELVDLFGLEVAADVDEGIVEVAPAAELPAEVVPEV